MKKNIRLLVFILSSSALSAMDASGDESYEPAVLQTAKERFKLHLEDAGKYPPIDTALEFFQKLLNDLEKDPRVRTLDENKIFLFQKHKAILEETVNNRTIRDKNRLQAATKALKDLSDLIQKNSLKIETERTQSSPGTLATSCNQVRPSRQKPFILKFESRSSDVSNPKAHSSNETPLKKEERE